MKDRIVASRYAKALLAALPDAASADTADEFLKALADAIERSRELRDALLNPGIPRSARRAVIAALAEGQSVPKELLNFLLVVVDHGRAGALPAMAATFHELKERALGVVPVTMTSAAPLPADLQNRARRALERITGSQVRLDFAVDPSLVGGAITRIGSRVYDGSLKTQLALLKRRMAEE